MKDTTIQNFEDSHMRMYDLDLKVALSNSVASTKFNL